jgi:hypothetical protein
MVEDLCATFSDGCPNVWSAAEVEARRLEFLEDLVRQRNAFVASHQDHLVAALPENVRGQMMTA